MREVTVEVKGTRFEVILDKRACTYLQQKTNAQNNVMLSGIFKWYTCVITVNVRK